MSHVDQGALCGIRHFVLLFNVYTYMAKCCIKERMAMLILYLNTNIKSHVLHTQFVLYTCGAVQKLNGQELVLCPVDGAFLLSCRVGTGQGPWSP